MQNKQALWIVSGAASLLAGAAALYRSVKNAALRTLDREGAFDALRTEHNEALHALLQESAQNAAARVGQQTRSAVAELDSKAWTEKNNIIHRKGADTFSGAWNLLPSKERAGCLGFAAVTSVVAGAITYGLGAWRKNIRKAPPSSGTGINTGSYSGGDGVWIFDGSSSHHHHHDSGGWFGGGDGGGHSGGFDGGGCDGGGHGF